MNILTAVTFLSACSLVFGTPIDRNRQLVNKPRPRDKRAVVQTKIIQKRPRQDLDAIIPPQPSEVDEDLQPGSTTEHHQPSSGLDAGIKGSSTDIAIENGLRRISSTSNIYPRPVPYKNNLQTSFGNEIKSHTNTGNRFRDGIRPIPTVSPTQNGSPVKYGSPIKTFPSLRKGEYPCGPDGTKVCKLKPGEVPKGCGNFCQYPLVI